ncbi:Cullin-1 [Eumeta japonica]|uniref:Cullin-1 n=1 Tax=Eumeta variegata TaxID=151549 RepID=A0A4C1ZU04_EUMVA|nr:Cullin-1 [Eumeta japonica]
MFIINRDNETHVNNISLLFGFTPTCPRRLSPLYLALSLSLEDDAIPRRSGVIYSPILVSLVIDCYVALSVKEEKYDIGYQHLGLYKETFEAVFLEDTEKFYVRESSEFLRNNPFTAYMIKVEQRLHEEETRVQLYLHETVMDQLTKICNRVLIEKHLEIFYAEFQKLMDNDKNADLGRMYVLLTRVPDGLVELRRLLEQHIHDQGLQAIDKNCEAAYTVFFFIKSRLFPTETDIEYRFTLGHSVRVKLKLRNQRGDPFKAIQRTSFFQDPRVYVSTILEVQKKYTALVLQAFHNDSRFVTALDKACIRFINKTLGHTQTTGHVTGQIFNLKQVKSLTLCILEHVRHVHVRRDNAVTTRAKSSSKSAELLARYCDMVLKKSSGNFEETELEDALNQVMVVFKYVEDKDVFQNFYHRLLAKRLVRQMSASDDAEAWFSKFCNRKKFKSASHGVAGSNSNISVCHRRDVTSCAVPLRPVSESSGGPLPASSPHSPFHPSIPPSIRSPIPARKIGNAAIAPVELRAPMGCFERPLIAVMISKLKQASGSAYTSKLQRLFQDIEISKDLNEQFRKHAADRGERPPRADFGARVLSSGSWPFRLSTPFRLPVEFSLARGMGKEEKPIMGRPCARHTGVSDSHRLKPPKQLILQWRKLKARKL